MARDYPFGQGEVTLVSTDWLEGHLGQGKVMLLDAQPNIHDYIQEHIRGAVHMNEGLLRVAKNGLPGVFAPREAVAAVFGRLGLRPDVPVVVYTGAGAFKGWGDGLGQTMVAYSLARYGHDRVHILDGGIDKWKKEGRELVQEFPRVEETAFPVGVREEYFIGYDEFVDTKDAEGIILLDARPQGVYEGKGPWMKPGHIPGAVNLPWRSLMDDDNPQLLKTDEQVRAMLDAQGVARDKAVICSCGTGREATNEFILLKWYLGYPKVRIYEGSFTEWTSYPDNPTATGPSPR